MWFLIHRIGYRCRGVRKPCEGLMLRDADASARPQTLAALSKAHAPEYIEGEAVVAGMRRVLPLGAARGALLIAQSQH